MIELPEVMKPKDLVKYLNCSKTTAYELCRRRDFLSFRIGKSYYIRADKISEWIDRESKKVKI